MPAINTTAMLWNPGKRTRVRCLHLLTHQQGQRLLCWHLCC